MIEFQIFNPFMQITEGCYLDVFEYETLANEDKKQYEHEITETHAWNDVSEGNKSFFLKMGKGKMFMNGKEIK